MTFCLGVKTKYGIVGISDRRITSGSEVSSKKKLFTREDENGSIFIMTAGLRSVRDKAITYFEENLENRKEQYDRLYQAVNEFGFQIKKVAKEDKLSIVNSGLSFDISAIIGGQFKKDEEHKLFLVYSQGNWIEVTSGSPFIVIGNSAYGKPILYRNIKFDSTNEQVLKIGFLAFDSTRVSANDVDFPIDIIQYEKDSFKFKENSFDKKDLEHISEQWNLLLSESVQKLSGEWITPIL